MKDLETAFHVSYQARIGRVYQIMLDAIIVTAAVLKRYDKELTIQEWEPLKFTFRFYNSTANQMNNLWRELESALKTIDSKFSVVYTGDTVECEYGEE